MWDDDDDAETAAAFGELVKTNIHSDTLISTVEAWGRFAGRYGLLALNHREQRRHADVKALASDMVRESAAILSFCDQVRR